MPPELNDSSIKTNYSLRSRNWSCSSNLEALISCPKSSDTLSQKSPLFIQAKMGLCSAILVCAAELKLVSSSRLYYPEAPQPAGKLHHGAKLLLLLLLSQISLQVCRCIVVLFLYYGIISMQFQMVAHLRTNSQLELLCKQLFNPCLFIPRKISAITASFKTCIINIFCYLLRYSRFGARLKVSLVAPVFFTCNTSNSLQTACCIIRKKPKNWSWI